MMHLIWLFYNYQFIYIIRIFVKLILINSGIQGWSLILFRWRGFKPFIFSGNKSTNTLIFVQVSFIARLLAVTQVINSTFNYNCQLNNYITLRLEFQHFLHTTTDTHIHSRQMLVFSHNVKTMPLTMTLW